MEVFEAVRTVLAVRRYAERPVPAEVIGQIIEAGRLTASGMNAQPWHFIVVENRETLEQFGKLLPSGRYTAQAPLAIVVATEPSKMALSDASRAIQSMVLTAWAAGVGSNWVGFGGLDAIRTLLGIPETLDVLAVLPFGYPLDQLGRGKKERKPLGEVASQERFGQPYGEG